MKSLKKFMRQVPKLTLKEIFGQHLEFPTTKQTDHRLPYLKKMNDGKFYPLSGASYTVQLNYMLYRQPWIYIGTTDWKLNVSSKSTHRDVFHSVDLCPKISLDFSGSLCFLLNSSFSHHFEVIYCLYVFFHQGVFHFPFSNVVFETLQDP